MLRFFSAFACLLSAPFISSQDQSPPVEEIRTVMIEFAKGSLSEFSQPQIFIREHGEEPESATEIRNLDWSPPERTAWFQVAVGVYDLNVRVPGQGTAWIENFAVTQDVEHIKLDVQLEGAGVIRGQLLEKNGEPAALRELWALRRSGDSAILADRPNSPMYVGSWAMRYESGAGCWAAVITTDTEGRFEFAGLEPGAYDVKTYFNALPIFEQKATALRTAPFETSASDRSFRVHTTRVRVSLTGEGDLAAHAHDAATRYGSWDANRPFIELRAIEADELQNRTSARKLKSSDDAARPSNGAQQTTWEVVPGERYTFVSMYLERGTYVEHELIAPAHGELLELDLELPAPSAPSKLTVQASQPDGAEVRFYDMEIRRRASNQLVFQSSRSAQRHYGLRPVFLGDVCFLPAGHYALRFRPMASLFADPSSLVDPGGLFEIAPLVPTRYWPIEMEVELAPGETRDLKLELKSAGELEFVVNVAGSPSAGVAQLVESVASHVRLDVAEQELDSTRHVVIDALRAGDHPFGGRVEILEVDGSWRELGLWGPVPSPVALLPHSHAPWGGVVRQFVPGQRTGMLQPLSTGEHTLRFSLPGYETVERSVTIEEGKRSTLQLELKRVPD